MKGVGDVSTFAWPRTISRVRKPVLQFRYHCYIVPFLALIYLQSLECRSANYSIAEYLVEYMPKDLFI